MSLQIEKKWLGEEAVDGSKIKILDGQALVAEGQSGDVDLIKLNGSGDAVVPQGVIASEAHVASEISAEAALRISGDAASVTSSNSYTDGKILLENGRAMQAEYSLQLNINAEESARVSADSALSSRLDSLESDPVTKSYVDSADSSLDGKITTEKNRIDAILSASTADKDSFAEIVALINSIDTSSDEAFASYVLSNNAAVAQLTSDLASEVSTLEAADSALDGRIDALEADPTTKTYVDAQVNLEGFARLDGDTNTLNSAKDYTDSKVLIENGRAMQAEFDLGSRIGTLENILSTLDLMFEVGVSGVTTSFIQLPYLSLEMVKVCVGRLNVFYGVDYTLSTVNGATRITWIGELASNGSSPIASGDKIFVTYKH